MTSGGAAPERRDVVVDASVATKWVLRDEDDVDRADALLGEMDRGLVVGYAPRQIHVEVAASLRKAVLTERLSEADAREALDDWLGIYAVRLVMSESEDLLADALPHALSLGITLFDALYVVLAERLDAVLFVAGQRLVRSLAARLPAVRSLSEYGAPHRAD